MTIVPSSEQWKRDRIHPPRSHNNSKKREEENIIFVCRMTGVP